jgi:predicted DNA-binding transcriptional regulator YafY
MMSDNRKAPLDRTLALLHRLSQSPDGLTIEEMAECLGQGRRSAERARNVIALHFDLEELSDGARKRFRIPDGLRRHFTRPNAEELSALKAEVDALRRRGGANVKLLESLLDKVQSSFDDREKRRIEPDLELLQARQRSFVGPGPRAEVAPETWRAAADAVMTGQCLEFDYLAAGATEPKWRRVICCGLLHGPVSYVVGMLPGSDRPPVHYRLDRMTNARVSAECGEVPQSFDLDAWLASSFGIWREDALEIVLRILPGAAERGRQWRFHPHQAVQELGDGSLRVTFRAGGMREIAEHLFQWAGDLVIEAPDELKDELEQRLEDAYEMLGDNDAE